MVSNRLSQHLEVKLASEKSGGKDLAPTALPAFEAMPSYVMEHNASRALKVTYFASHSEQSKSISFYVYESMFYFCVIVYRSN